MTIGAVIFDFGGVLCFHPTEQQTLAAADACGLSLDTFLDAFWSNRIPYDAGQIAPRAYWNAVATSAGVAPFSKRVIADMTRREIDFWSHFDQRVFDWIAVLRARGMKIGILSNLPRPLGEHLRTVAGFLDPFDQITFSYELGVVKPDASIYEHAIRGLGIAPSQILFLDDRRDNVQGALAAGLQSDLFTTWEGFVSDTLVRYPLPPPVSTAENAG